MALELKTLVSPFHIKEDFMNKEDYRILQKSIDDNKDLLIEIKDELTKEVTALKLTTQKLKFMSYAIIVGFAVYIGKPELLTVFLGAA